MLALERRFGSSPARPTPMQSRKAATCASALLEDRMDQIDAGGQRIAYERKGEGPPLVLCTDTSAIDGHGAPR
jgi:hypothetical protein